MKITTQTHRGSVYLVTLITVTAIASMVLIGMRLRTASNEQSALIEQMAETNNAIFDATELALQTIQNDPAWVLTAQKGIVYESIKLGDTTYAATVTDADTKALPDDDTKNYRLSLQAQSKITNAHANLDLNISTVDYLAYLKSMSAMFYWQLNETAGSSRASEPIQSQRGSYLSSSAAGLGTNDEGAPVPVFTNSNNIVGADWDNDYSQNNGSIAMWIKYTGPENSTTASPFIGLNYKYNGHPTLNLAVYNSSIYSYINNEGTWDSWYALNTSNGSIKSNQWHHIAITWGTSGHAIYIDGTLRAHHRANKYGVESAGILFGGNQPLYIGGGYDLVYSDTPYVGFTGSVAHVAYFDDYLTADQVAELAAIKPDEITISLVDDSWTVIKGE